MSRPMTCRPKPSRRALQAQLSHTSTISERVRGLAALGLPPAQTAKACGVSVSGLRNWANGSSEPRGDSAIVLDDLRAVTLLLLDRMTAERVVIWLTSRDPHTRRRPIDEIAVTPSDVLAAALNVSLDAKLAADARREDEELAKALQD